MKHTPTPWNVHCGNSVVSADGQIVADCPQMEPGDRCELDAAFIVRACNAHDELLSACLGVRAMLVGMGQTIPAMLENAVTIAQGGKVELEAQA